MSHKDFGFWFCFHSFIMVSATIRSALRGAVTASLTIAGFGVLFLMYYKSVSPPKCHPLPAAGVPPAKHANQGVSVKQTLSLTQRELANKPLMLLWFWPDNKKFDLRDCERLFNIDGCQLTDDRSLYNKSQGVLVFHKAIHTNLSNLPATRAKFQRWIWFNMDSPTNTARIAGIEHLFNLTLTYRRDADIFAYWKMTLKKNTDEDFVLPEKSRLLCWIVDSNDLQKKSEERIAYYDKLVEHMWVDTFPSSSDAIKGDNYFQTISGCKFYLSFENSIHRDYITEVFSGPLAAGTVPIVLGPPRSNYEKFAPATSFIHVDDFSDAATLAQFLQSLDRDNKSYRKFFDWRKFYTVRRHPTEDKHKFAHSICQACHHLGLRKEYRAIPDLYKWFYN